MGIPKVVISYVKMSMFLVFPETSDQYFAKKHGCHLPEHFLYVCTTAREMIQRRELGYMCLILSRPQYSKFATSILHVSSGMTLDMLFCFWSLSVVFYILYFNLLTIELIIVHYIRSSLFFSSPLFMQCAVFAFLLTSSVQP